MSHSRCLTCIEISLRIYRKNRDNMGCSESQVGSVLSTASGNAKKSDVEGLHL